MDTLITPDGAISLERFPFAGGSSHRAWDAADEWLLHHLETPAGRVLIVGEAFGVIATAWSEVPIIAYSDSVTALRAIGHNRSLNPDRPAAPIELIGADQPVPHAQVQQAIVRLPRSLDLLDHYLRAARASLPPDGTIWLGGVSKRWVPGVKGVTEQLLGIGKPSPFVKKARWIRFDGPFPPLPPIPKTSFWRWDEPPLVLHHRPGVFSHNHPDEGTRRLLSFWGDVSGAAPSSIADVGCGNGLIGLAAAAAVPSAQVVLTDDSFLAAATARDNAAVNGLASRCTIHACHGLEILPSASMDMVLCNPPFHFRNIQTKDVALFLFREAARVLRPGGQLWVVANAHLGYHVDLRAIFRECRVVDRDRRFIVLRARNREQSAGRTRPGPTGA